MATRKLTIKYGDASIGSGTYQVHGQHRMGEDFERGFVEFDVFVKSSSVYGLVAACEKLERHFRTPYQDLTVAYSGSTILTVSQKSNTGFDAVPSIEKIGNQIDTGLTRLYRCRVDYQRPADTSEELGLRQRTVEVSYSPSRRRTVTIRGEYTARSSNDARAEYEARIDALQASILSALSITTSELVSEVAGPATTNDKTMTFERVIREIVFGQGADSTDDSALVEQSLVISRRDDHPGDTGPGVSRVQTLDVRYSAAVDKDVTTDIEQEWTDIRDWVIGKVSAFGGGTLAVTAESVRLDYDENRFSVEMTALSRDGEKLEQTITVSDLHQHGTRRQPVWEGDNPYASAIFQGPAQYVRTIRGRVRYGSGLDIDAAKERALGIADDYLSKPSKVPDGEWDRVSDKADATRLVIGDDGNNFEVTDVDFEVIAQWVHPVAPKVVTPS